MRGATSRAMEIDSPPSMRSQQADRYIAQMWLRAELCTQSWDAARVQPCGWPPPSPLRVQRFPMSPHTLETADWLAPSTFRRDDPPRTRHRQASQPASQPARPRWTERQAWAGDRRCGAGGRRRRWTIGAGWLAGCVVFAVPIRPRPDRPSTRVVDWSGECWLALACSLRMITSRMSGLQ